MSDDNFLKMGNEGPVIDKSALAAAGKAFLNAAPEAPAATPDSAPALQSTVTVTPTEQPTAEGMPGISESVPSTLKVQQTQDADGVVQTQPVDAQGEPIDLPDTALVRIKVDGQDQVVSYGEAKKRMMLHSHYTKEMQALRQRETTFEARQTDLTAQAEMGEKLARIVSNPNLFIQYAQLNPALAEPLARAFGTTAQAAATGQTGFQPQGVAPVQAPFQPPANAEELTNFGEVNTLLHQNTQQLTQKFTTDLEAQAAAIRAELKKEVQGELASIQNQRELSALNTQIDQTIHANLTANPALSVIPSIDSILRVEAMKLGPRTADEMTEALNVVSKALMEQLDTTYNKARQTALVQKQKLVTGGIEPPVGGAPNTTVKPNLPNFVLPGGRMDIEAMKRAGKALFS